MTETYAQQYYSYYVCKEYLILSDAFTDKPYYIIQAEKDNYLHLVGVSTGLSAKDFFEKCFDGSLTEDDFEISSRNGKLGFRNEIMKYKKIRLILDFTPRII